MKSVQGDSGHAQLKMVADVYSHIIDDDRCLNAQRMEEAFYSGKKDPPEITRPQVLNRQFSLIRLEKRLIQIQTKRRQMQRF